MEEKINILEQEIENIKSIVYKNNSIDQQLEKKDNKKEDDKKEEIIDNELKEPFIYKQFEPNNQTVYCQCCNFTNSNHNAVRLILEIMIIFLNLSSVCGLCYIVFMK